jgi:hypothetical protein
MKFTLEVREKIATIKTKVQQQLMLLEKLEWYAWLEDRGHSWDEVKFVLDASKLSRADRHRAAFPPKEGPHVYVKLIFKDETEWIGWCPFSYETLACSETKPEDLAKALTINDR